MFHRIRIGSPTAGVKEKPFQIDLLLPMDGSKRSSKANAFFTGFGRHRRLVLFDTLIEKHTIDELVAVLAHEVGHFELKHILKSLVLSIVTLGGLFWIFSLLLSSHELYASFQLQNESVYSGIILSSLVCSPLLRTLSFFTNGLSRRHEFEADAFAARSTGSSTHLINALKKLTVENLSHLTPHPFKVALDYSHPPTVARIEALKKIPLSP